MPDNRNQALEGHSIDDEELETHRARLKLGVFRQLRALFRKLQQDKKLTQKELAHRLNVDEGLISKRLRGEANFTIDTLCDLARGMDARLDVRVVPLDELRNQTAVTQTKSNASSQMLVYPMFLSEPQSHYKGEAPERAPYLPWKAYDTSHSISTSGSDWYMGALGPAAEARRNSWPDVKRRN
jgi:transcriptional regulator with XRE-family HTH domain